MIDLGINLFQEIAALGGGGGYPIINSLRFNDNDSAYLSRTPSVAGNRKTWTWSGWVKRGNVGINGYLFGADTAVGSGDGFGFISSDQLKVYVNGAVTGDLVTNALFRDVGGWYHLIVSADSTQATASNRIKVYVNGEQVTSFATETYPPQNFDFDINGVFAHWLGRVYVYYSDGYMAEINFIDGQALTPDDFGQIDATTGEWSPKKYSGTYGTNGFYLPFNGNANDDSGNGNNWTENNLASTDYMIDTPTNNFNVLNPLNTYDPIGGGSAVTFQEGNLQANADNSSAIATIGVSQGKWYFELLQQNSGNFTNGVGFYKDGTSEESIYRDGGTFRFNGTESAYGSSWQSSGDVIGVALDLDNTTISFYKNGVSQGSAKTDLSAGTYIPIIYCRLPSDLFANFGADSSFAGNKTRQGNTDANGKGDFYYTPPTGYLALCTDNTGGDNLANVT